MDIHGRLIILTGASQGIGAAAAKSLAAKGGKVALLARSKEKLEAVKEQIESAGGEAYVYPADLSNPAEVDLVCQKILAELGSPDILINNAGAGRWLFVEETSPEENQQMMALPYFAAFNLCHFLLPAMMERGSGLIINLNSPVSRLSWAGSTGYACSRWALRGLTACLRGDLHNTGVNVAEVVPGEVRSEYFTNNPGTTERLPSFTKLLPVLETEDVADMLIDCIENDRREVVRPLMLKLSMVFERHFPGISRWLVTRAGWTH